MITNKVVIQGKNILLKWYDSNKNISKYAPVTQSSGFCFNKKGEMLIVRKTKHSSWMIPGGGVEKKEKHLETFHREADEEASILLDKVKLIGYQKVEFLDEKKKPFYQVRYFAIIKKMKKLKADPDFGHKLELKFIKPKDFTKYLAWGSIGEHLVKKALEFFEKENKSNTEFK